MAAIKRFEEIDAWKRARVLCRRIYSTSNSWNDYGLRDQIRSAAVSVMANMAEGFDCGSAREFIRFLGYSLHSSSEIQSHLYVALDGRYISPELFSSLYFTMNSSQ